MTDEQWEELRPFAEAEAEARAKLAAAQAMNLPTDLRERVEAEAIIQAANSEYFKVYMALREARQRIIGQ